MVDYKLDEQEPAAPEMGQVLSRDIVSIGKMRRYKPTVPIVTECLSLRRSKRKPSCLLLLNWWCTMHDSFSNLTALISVPNRIHFGTTRNDFQCRWWYCTFPIHVFEQRPRQELGIQGIHFVQAQTRFCVCASISGSKARPPKMIVAHASHIRP